MRYEGGALFTPCSSWIDDTEGRGDDELVRGREAR